MGPFPYRGATEDQVCALTFDDGPNEPFTSQIADVLASREVRGTFFQVAAAVVRDPDSTRRLVAAGHLVGNHSLTHRFSRCWTAGNLRSEIVESQQILTEVIGARPALYRPPWLLRVPAMFPLLHQHGLRPVSGTFCHPFEVAQPDAARISRRAIKTASKPGSMLIFHDGWDGRGANRHQTIEAVKQLLDVLQARGHTFITVDRLLGLPAYQGDHPPCA